MIPAPDILNLIANAISIIGIAALLYLAFILYRLVRRVELVLAPKTGIEGYLAMCGQVIEAESDGKCVVNSKGEILLVNRAMEDISGYHRSELIGQSVEILVPEKSRSQHAAVFRPSFMMESSSRPMRGLELRHKRGVSRQVDIRLGYYRDPKDEYAIASVRMPNG